jgi:Na+-translocating ferredoxin:NAD+ oxidoreductase RnfG subunit
MKKLHKILILFALISLGSSECQGTIKEVSSQQSNSTWLEIQQKKFEELIKSLPKEFRDDPIAYLTKKVKDTVTTFDQVSTHFKDAGKNN